MNRWENVARMLDSRTLVWERHFDVEPERLWQAVATREGLAHWFMPTDVEIEQGGRFSFGGGWEGTVSVVDPPRRIVFTPDESDDAFLEFRIEPTATGCRFTLTDRMGANVSAREQFDERTPEHEIYQPGGRGTHWSGVASGYHGFVDALETHIAGREVPYDHEAGSRFYMKVLESLHRSPAA